MLNHKDYIDQDILKTVSELDQLSDTLDQKHRMQRKIQFFLDIRGYLVMNQIKGDYVEFGIYKGEMMYCAWKILEKTGCLSQYVGLDTFCGEPKLKAGDARVNTMSHEGDYLSEYEMTKAFLEKFLKDKVRLICGDFRQPGVLKELDQATKATALAVIDCNLLSSIESSLDAIIPKMAGGGVLFIDDFFFNMKEGTCPVLDLLQATERKFGCHFLLYQTYAPFARAFIIVFDGKAAKS